MSHAYTEDQLVEQQAIGQNLETPCLLIHDATDQYIPLQDDEMVSLSINGAQIVRTKGLGHMRILQDDGVVARVSPFVCEPAKQLFMAA
jgi:pimeloyl-ACP methyl ester carboxylesterase